MDQSQLNDETRFRFIADTVDDAISVRDIKGTLIYCNHAYIKLFGNIQTKADDDPFGHICLEDRERVRNTFNQVIQQNYTDNITYRAILPDGKTHSLEAHGVPILNETTQILEVVFVTRDLTRQQQIADAQYRYNRELKQHVDELAALNEIATQIYRCNSVNDLRKVIIKDAKKLFLAAGSGGIYVFNSELNQFCEFLSWGKPSQRENFFSKQHCQAVPREDGMYVIDDLDPNTALLCKHVGDIQYPYICIHRRGRGDIDLLLHFELQNGIDELLSDEDKHRFIRSQTEIATAIANHAALAIENLGQKDQLRKAAELDELTGLFNRHYLVTTLKREVLRAARTQTILGVIMADIDHFKKINDSFNHSGGDYVLREVGIYLRSKIRQTDIACRYGGEEFMLIMPDTTPKGLMERAEALQKGIKELDLNYNGRPIDLTLSLGVAMMAGKDAIAPDNVIRLGDSAQFVAEEKAEELTQAADQALYLAKEQGRDRVVYWNDVRTTILEAK
jgi:diguanylate cyclase (GGDEF)-like protein/PAS domain S-box-containing protein